MSDDDRPKIEQPYEVLGTSRRYVLGEVPEGYGIWDSLAGDQLVERFPLPRTASTSRWSASTS